MIPHAYWRSTTPRRVRIALDLKGLACEPVPVNLVAGDQRAADHVALNPGRGVPTPILDDGAAPVQSMAILDRLEETRRAPETNPTPPDAISRRTFR